MSFYWMCCCNLTGETLEEHAKHCTDGTHNDRKLLQFIKAISSIEDEFK